MEEIKKINEKNEGLAWNYRLTDDGLEFYILPKGYYNFVIDNFERGRFAGSEKIGPCNKAILTLAVTTDDGKTVKVKTELLLHSSLESKLSSFFRSIGLKKRGEAMIMDWNAVQGAKGRAYFNPRTYKTASGEERTVNNVAYFVDYDEKYFADVPDLFIDVEDIPF